MTKKSAPARFQSNTDKTFRERYVGDKSSRNRPHFSASKPASSTSPSKSRYAARPVTERTSSLTLNRANGASGTVEVTVKRSENKSKEKKTGPLSPRAPEKIKKNRAEEMKVCGENACSALFAERPESIVRVWTTVTMAHRAGDLFRYLAANKKVYHVVESAELALVSGTEHHGGICMLVKKPHAFTLSGYLSVPHQQDCLIFLNGVNNAQNIGGILRTCAFFGIKNIVTENTEMLYSSTACRIAEGGAEYIRALEAKNDGQALEMLRQAGYRIVHISTGHETIKHRTTTLDKMLFEKKTVFVLSESTTAHLASPQDTAVRFAAGGPIKNGLNVAVNAGILLAKWYTNN